MLIFICSCVIMNCVWFFTNILSVKKKRTRQCLRQLSKNIRWYPYNFTIRYQLHCQERGYLLVQIHDPYQSFTFSFSFISKVFAFNLQISEFSANTSSTASDFIPITLWKKSFSFSSSFSLFLSSLILFPFYTLKITRQNHLA